MKIEEIKSPEFLKKLKIDELEDLAKEIRRFIIENVSAQGGHLSPNLGVVELIIAMHYVFNSPHDKFIFDVGHQTYTHKILTGRAKEFKTLRQKDGLSGYLKYSESPHDVWEAGHSSTALSAAGGFLEARKSGADIGEIIAFVGDGALQNGLSFEGLNYLGAHNNEKTIIIVNDNDMSISKNVGGLAKNMNKIRIKKSYTRVKNLIPRFLHRCLRKTKNTLRAFVYGDNLFSALGHKYYGPIDGHNLRELITYLEFAKNSSQSVVLHIKTIKGKGYSFAEEDNQGSWHGVSPFDYTTGQSYNNDNDKNKVSWSYGISEILLQELKLNDKIRIISPAMISGASLEKIVEEYPDKIIDVGIAEEHALVMAASMAKYGLIPVISIYSTFLQRGYDQLSHDICRSNHHVIFLIDRAGLVPGDGSTHQGVFDIAYMSHLPNMQIMAAKNLAEAKALFKYALSYNGPIALRYPKLKVDKLNDENIENISQPSWKIEKDISKINIITYGPDVHEYYKALKDKDVGLINARFIKPLDEEIIKKLHHTKVFVVEEVVKNGSLGALLTTYINDNALEIDIVSFNLGDIYPDSGTAAEIKKEMGIDVDSIIEKI